MIHDTRGEVSALNQQIIVLVSDTFLSLRCIPPGEIQFIPWLNNRDFIKGGNSLCKVSFRILSIQSKHWPLNGRQPLIEQITHFECENCNFFWDALWLDQLLLRVHQHISALSFLCAIVTGSQPELERNRHHSVINENFVQYMILIIEMNLFKNQQPKECTIHQS